MPKELESRGEMIRSWKNKTRRKKENEMRAFHNDEKIRNKYLDRVKAHALSDEIIKGHYWSNGKGCAVGCTIHSGDHMAYETELGIPRILARLEDNIFEALPNQLAKEWPIQFLSAIKLGVDLSNVWPKFAIWMLIDGKYGVLQFAKGEQAKAAIQKVADMFSHQLSGKAPSRTDWYAAYAAAAAAANADAAAAAYVAAANAAAYAATYAAAYAAADAADAAAYADDAAYAANAAAAAAAAAANAANAAGYAANAAANAAADAAADAADAAADAAANAAYAAAAANTAKTEWRIAQSKKLLELLEACE